MEWLAVLTTHEIASPSLPDWLWTKEFWSIFVVVAGALFKAVRDQMKAMRVSIKNEILAEQSVATVEAKNKEIERLSSDLTECRSRNERLMVMLETQGAQE